MSDTLAGNPEMYFEKDYPFGKVTISDEETAEGVIRTLAVDGARESACYTDEGRHFELIFAYTQEFARVLEGSASDRHVLLIGGAGFSVPKYFISRFHTGSVDVIELHREMYDIAMNYFFLDELYLKYHPDRTGRLKVFFDDGNHYIEERRDRLLKTKDDSLRYDIILDDAFSGRIPDRGMLSEHTISCIHDILSPGGCYMINIISPLASYGSMQIALAQSILKTHFRHVRVSQVDPNRSPAERQNCIIYASDTL